MLQYLNPVKIIVLLTFIYFLFSFDKGKKVHILLLGILTLALANETLASCLKYHHVKIHLTTTVYVFIHCVLWLCLIGVVSQRIRIATLAISLFTVFAICDFLIIDGMQAFNSYAFIAGAFLYAIFFIYDSYCRLKREQLAYFAMNNYILLASPLLFFIGFSILLGFENKQLQQASFLGTTLYALISDFINFFYYLLVVIYIYRENKNRHAE